MSQDVNFIEKTFDEVLAQQEIIGVDTGSHVVAAADFILILKRKRPYSKDIELSENSLSEIKSKITNGIVTKAVLAIQKIKQPDISELVGFWEDDEDWLNDINDIEDNLMLLDLFPKL